MPIDKLPAVYQRFRQSNGMAALAVRFAILTAARPGEAAGAAWPEIKRKAALSHQAGSIKALAVTSATRLREFPDVPTVAETIPGFQIVAWFALMARAGTPTHIVHKISQDLQSVLKEPAGVERFAKLGVYPRLASPAETAEFIRSEQEALKPIIKDAGLGMQ